MIVRMSKIFDFLAIIKHINNQFANVGVITNIPSLYRILKRKNSSHNILQNEKTDNSNYITYHLYYPIWDTMSFKVIPVLP